jgi:hypothetical protein
MSPGTVHACKLELAAALGLALRVLAKMPPSSGPADASQCAGHFLLCVVMHCLYELLHGIPPSPLLEWALDTTSCDLAARQVFDAMPQRLSHLTQFNSVPLVCGTGSHSPF